MAQRWNDFRTTALRSLTMGEALHGKRSGTKRDPASVGIYLPASPGQGVDTDKSRQGMPPGFTSQAATVTSAALNLPGAIKQPVPLP
jgi:hypothetical protein